MVCLGGPQANFCSFTRQLQFQARQHRCKPYDHLYDYCLPTTGASDSNAKASVALTIYLAWFFEASVIHVIKYCEIKNICGWRPWFYFYEERIWLWGYWVAMMTSQRLILFYPFHSWDNPNPKPKPLLKKNRISIKIYIFFPSLLPHLAAFLYTIVTNQANSLDLSFSLPRSFFT